jgi:hypothetical protein
MFCGGVGVDSRGSAAARAVSKSASMAADSACRIKFEDRRLNFFLSLAICFFFAFFLQFVCVFVLFVCLFVLLVCLSFVGFALSFVRSFFLSHAYKHDSELHPIESHYAEGAPDYLALN